MEWFVVVGTATADEAEGWAWDLNYFPAGRRAQAEIRAREIASRAVEVVETEIASMRLWQAANRR